MLGKRHSKIRLLYVAVAEEGCSMGHSHICAEHVSIHRRLVTSQERSTGGAVIVVHRWELRSSIRALSERLGMCYRHRPGQTRVSCVTRGCRVTCVV